MGQLRPLSYARQVVVTTLQHVAMWLSLGTFILFVGMVVTAYIKGW